MPAITNAEIRELNREIKIPTNRGGFRALLEVLSELGLTIPEIAACGGVLVEEAIAMHNGALTPDQQTHDRMFHAFLASYWWHANRKRQSWSYDRYELSRLPSDTVAAWADLPRALHDDWVAAWSGPPGDKPGPQGDKYAK